MSEFKISIPTSELKITLEKEKKLFLISILTQSGLPTEESFPAGLLNNTEDKIKLRKLLFDFGNNIFYSETEGGIKIYCEGAVIAELFDPEKVFYYFDSKPYFELRYRYNSCFEKA